MKVLKLKIEGLEVKYWQIFLKKQNLFDAPITGIFDASTKKATIAFQAKSGLKKDAIVGKNTLSAAQNLGFIDVFLPNFPNRPPFNPLPLSARTDAFGKFDYIHKPLPNNKENIEILGDWEEKNIVLIEIPQLKPFTMNGSGKARFHRLVATKAVKLFEDWEKAELTDRIISWGGAYMPRFARKKIEKKVLSNHAFGSAFDINFDENPLNIEPALIGAKGCTRELVQIANENGFFWGGHFTSPLDGMHFEMAVIGSQPKGMERGDVFEEEENAQDIL